jgi:hypothetical protein
VTRFNIATPKTYKDKAGNEKTTWLNVGTMVYFEPTEQKDGSFIIELNLLPGVTFRAFEQKPKEERRPNEEIPY